MIVPSFVSGVSRAVKSRINCRHKASSVFTRKINGAGERERERNRESRLQNWSIPPQTQISRIHGGCVAFGNISKFEVGPHCGLISLAHVLGEATYPSLCAVIIRSIHPSAFRRGEQCNATNSRRMNAETFNGAIQYSPH